MKTSLLKVIVVTILCSAATGFSTTIVSYVGSVGLDQAQAWRDNTVAKTYSFNGTNTYGNAGYLVFGTKTDTTGGSSFGQSQGNSYFPDLNPASNIHWSMPSWINSANTAGASYVIGAEAVTKSVLNFGGAFDAANFNWNPSDYPVINNPQNLSSNYRVGILTTDSLVTDTVDNFLTLEFVTAGTYRLGLLTNTIVSNTADSMDRIGIWNGVSATANNLTRGTPELSFFDLTVQAGDNATIFGFIDATPGRGVLSYMTLDVVPEPSVGQYFILGLAGLAGFVVRRFVGKCRPVADTQV
jgi:hypothetical protein